MTVPHTSKLVSADFPGAAVAQIRKVLGPEVIAMFGQGCNANINSFPLRSKHEDADAAGTKLGEAVLKAIKESAPITATEFKVRHHRLKLPSRALPAPELVTELKAQNKNNAARMKQLNKISALQEKGGSAPPRRFDLSALMLGDEWGLVAMSYEVFCQYELWIDKHAPFKRTMVLSLTNGGRAYIGDDEALALGPKGGYEAACLPNWAGHETMSPHFGPPAVGAEKLIQEALQALWK